MQIAHIAIARWLLLWLAVVIVSAGVFSAALLANRDDLPLPQQWVQVDRKQTQKVLPTEAVIRVHELAIAIRQWDLSGLDLFDEKHGSDDYVNYAVDLARQGNPDAEYVIGWLFGNFSGRHFPAIQLVDVSTALGIFTDYLDDSYNERMAVKWYERAISHGSPQACAALGNMLLAQDRDGKSGVRGIALLQSAIARGDVEAQIDLGIACEYGLGGVPTNPQLAASLYERAIKSTNEDCVNRALMCLLSAWKEKKAIPSPEFCDGAGSAFEYLHALDVSLTNEKFEHLFEYRWCSPEPYGPDRYEMLQRIRARYKLASWPSNR